jgi:hypothetical protein
LTIQNFLLLGWALLLSATAPVASSSSAFAQAGTIDTVIGGSNGDGGAATNAIVDPFGIESRNGDLYIADFNDDRIRRVQGSNGIITTVAGTGSRGFVGDGGPALQAELNGPADVAFDAVGNMYIADLNNRRVRRINLVGNIETVAGNGHAGFEGDGVLATTTSVSSPEAIALDLQGNLYIGDVNNRRVRRVTPAGIITTVAGTGVTGYSGDGGPATQATLTLPKDVWVDLLGNLYIADFVNGAIRRVDPTGIITTVAGSGITGFFGDGGPATLAMLRFPLGVVTDAANNLFIVDSDNYRLRRVEAATQTIDTFAGNGQNANAGDGGPALNASIFSPDAVSLDSVGNVYVSGRESTLDAWSKNHTVRRIAPNGVISTVVGISHNGDGGPASKAIIDPHRIRFGEGTRLNDVYIADRRNHQIRLVSGTTGVITTVAGDGDSGFAGDGGPALTARLNAPRGVKSDASGNIWIADSNNNRVRRVNAAGTIMTVAGNGLGGYNGDNQSATAASLNVPYAVDTDAQGNLYIADRFNNRIRKVTPSGMITSIAGTGRVESTGNGGLAVQAGLGSPTDVLVAPDGAIYIVETATHQVRKITPDGIIRPVAGTGTSGGGGNGGPALSAQLNSPQTVAVDQRGNVFIGDQNNTVRRVDAATGLITTFAGTGVYGNSGDGGPAVNAELQPPTGLMVAVNGDLYIALSDSGSIRRVVADTPFNTPTPIPTDTPTRTNTPLNTSTWTFTQTPTRTGTGTFTLTPTPTRTFTFTPSPTRTSTASPTPSRTSTATATFTPTSSFTHTTTPLPISTATPSRTVTVTATFTPSPTFSWSPTVTATSTSTPTRTHSFTPTASRTRTPSRTTTPTFTHTHSRTPSFTRTPTATRTLSSTPTASLTRTSTSTRAPSSTPTASFTRTSTATRSPSPEPTFTRTAVLTATRTNTATRTFTRGTTPTRTSTGTPTYTMTRTLTPSVTWTVTATRSETPTPAPSETATPELETPSATATHTVPPLPTGTPSATPSATATVVSQGPGAIRGEIRNVLNDKVIPLAEVLLRSPEGALTSTVTNASGVYTFAGLLERTWTVEPRLLGEIGAAVDSLDAAMVLEAVEGQRTLSPEQMFAADVNGDGTVDTDDAALILDFATGSIPSFPVSEACSSDWIFLPIATPLSGQELLQPAYSADDCSHGAITLNPLVGEVDGRNFLAILFGDVDGTWASLSVGGGARDAFELGRPSLRGSSVRVPIEIVSTQGFQALHLIVDYDPERMGFHAAYRPRTETANLLAVEEVAPGTLAIAAASAYGYAPAETFTLEFVTTSPMRYPDVVIRDATIGPR